MIAAIIMNLIIGFLIGYMFCLRWGNDINLIHENKKLRKENEVLWSRLKDEGKVEKF